MKNVSIEDRRKIKEEISKREEKFGPLDQRQKRRIEKNIIKKHKRENKIRAIKAILVGLGITIGAGTGAGVTAALNAGENKGIENKRNEITVDLDKANKDIKVNTQNDREIFVNGIKVNIEDINQSEELKENTQKEIDLLKEPEEVCDYLKDIYVDEYNKVNKTNISKENIELYKHREDKKIYQDKATNGDNILREEYITDDNKKYINIDPGVITAKVNDENQEIINKQTVINYQDKYEVVHSKDEQVDKNEDNVLSKIGEVIDTGISYYTIMEGKTTDQEKKLKFKTKFVDAVKEYKDNQIKQIVEDSKEER